MPDQTLKAYLIVLPAVFSMLLLRGMQEAECYCWLVIAFIYPESATRYSIGFRLIRKNETVVH